MTKHNVMRFAFPTMVKAALFINELDMLDVAHKGAAKKGSRWIVTTDTRALAHAAQLNRYMSELREKV